MGTVGCVRGIENSGAKAMCPSTGRALYSKVMRWVACHCIAQTRAYRLALALRSELHAVRGVGLLAVVFL